ncbi:zinc-dependent dehydrogenase [Rhodoferax sp.]|uniref:zinc-dependent dehydrogenase n=1 Tax=Rhodoferax sp. TaxID=50421 RepID=UPI0025D17EFF|nr:zinc-dependent dehydrogenase [Rhodoferax sp.]MCM2297058.1 zinc-dependent dehydrogenase [Rhodoferax sp.]
MKAAVLRAPNVLEVGDIATPEAGPGELILSIRAATVCGTDLRILSGKKTKGIRFPSIIGHEFAGVVVQTGDGVTGFATGDRVCMDPVVPCRACAYCKAGLENVCQNRQAMGYEFDGAFAQYIRIPAIALQAGNVFKMPAGMSFEAAALSEPLACCINGQKNAQVGLGDSVVILGAGPIGLMHAALAKAAGARQVIISEPNAARRQAALERGVNHACDPTKENLLDFVKQKTEGLGADVVILAIGVPALANEALNLVRKGGRVNLFAGFSQGDMSSIDVNLIHYNEITVTGASALSRSGYELALNMLSSGQIDATSLITHRYSVADSLAAFDAAASGNAIKVAIHND